jgi:hypothetical protein
VRRAPLLRTVALAAVLALLAGCSGDDAADDDAGAATTTTTAPAPTVVTSPPFVPIPGGTDDAGDPLPPPVHAVFSVVVRGDASWSPYASRELTGLDAEAADAIGARLRQIDAVLTTAAIPASIELSYGAAAALCETDPEVLDLLESHGHVIAMHARTNGETFRALRALDDCDRVPATTSGLPWLADPVGPEPTTADSLYDAMAVLSLHGIGQIVGAVSPMCESLGLAGHTNEYGTGAFTAPWRSAWVDGNACADSPAGRIVVVDQVALAPGDGDERVDAASLAAVDARMTQTLGWASDQRYDEPEELPAPGFLTWGVTVRLDDLIAPTPDPEAEGDETADGAEGTTTTTTVEPVVVDPRVAPLSEETLAALAALLTEWQPAADDGRLIWLTPEAVGLLLRPA